MNTASASTVVAGIDQPLTLRLARSIARRCENAFSPETREKLRLCLLDFLGCAIEARALPWARQAAALAERGDGGCTIVGASRQTFASDAAFANAVAGHGLLREDTHAGSVSHLGVVVLPALLAVAQDRGLSGAAFTDAAIVGYEVGAKIGRALVTPDFSRAFRPAGFTGPIAAAAALSCLLRLDEAETASALALAANMACGLNQWPHTGADDMFFHAGQAASSGVRAVRLAVLGARASEGALDGEAGLLRVYRPDRAVPSVTLFDGAEPEIASVYFKAAPVCNFAQTPCQATIALASENHLDAARVRSIRIRVSDAARAYPGCDYTGPYDRILQAKLSIQFAVASALLRGRVDEAAYRKLDDPALVRLASLVEVEADPEFTSAFPKAQGAEIIVVLDDGRMFARRLQDLAPADRDLVRRRFAAAAGEFAGEARAQSLQDAVDGLDAIADIGRLMRLAADPGPLST